MNLLATLAMLVTIRDCTASSSPPLSSTPSNTASAPAPNHSSEIESRRSARDARESETGGKIETGQIDDAPTSVLSLEKHEEPLSTPVVADRLSWSGYSFELREIGKHCEIHWVQDSTIDNSVTMKPVMLEVSPPCRFVRRNGKILSYRYPKQQVDGIVLISGTPPIAAIRAQWDLDRLRARGVDCGDKTQAVIVRKDKIEISSKVVDGMIVCPQIGVDEHLFADFAGVPPS